MSNSRDLSGRGSVSSQRQHKMLQLQQEVLLEQMVSVAKTWAMVKGQQQLGVVFLTAESGVIDPHPCRHQYS